MERPCRAMEEGLAQNGDGHEGGLNFETVELAAPFIGKLAVGHARNPP